MRGVAEQRNQQSAGGRPSRTVTSMLFSMLPLVLVVAGVAGLTGQCSFSPLGPSVEQGSAPTVDATAELHEAARRMDFPVFEPRLPAGWRANSADVEQLPSKARAVRVGWLTAGSHYMRLSQSSASEAELVSFETRRSPRARGVVEAGGLRWVDYDSVRSEHAWVTERRGVRLLITGSGSDREFRTFATAVAGAAPVAPQP